MEVEAVEMVDGVLGLLEVGHGDKAVALADAFAGLHDDVDLLYRAEGGEQLPQRTLCCIAANVVGKNGIASLQ